jgi:6-pyruvoyltetrahydropterin/6-carboxytetrahydropterin synthase
VTDELDHKHLNELAAFAEQNPSSELLARYVFRRMKDLLVGHRVRLAEVMVSEKASSKAYYTEDD